MTGRLLDYAGPVLRAARERAGATQRDVAERAGASTATVSRLENGIAVALRLRVKSSRDDR